MIGRDVEQDRDVAIEVGGQVDLVARQLEHIDAPAGAVLANPALPIFSPAQQGNLAVPV